MKTALIVDSTAGLTSPLIDHPDIYKLDLVINFNDGNTMPDTVDPEKNQIFYQKLSQVEVLPTTSQPQVGLYYLLVDELIQKGYQAVIAIHLSGKISGTYATAKMVLDEHKDQILSYVIDSKGASVGIEHMAEEFIQMNDSEMTLDSIYQNLLWLVDRTSIRFMVQDLNNLTKGGRLSSTEALLGNMLKIRPVLKFDEQGNMIVHDKIRTTKKVYANFIEWIKEEQNLRDYDFDIYIAHTDAYDEAVRLADLIEENFPGQYSCKIRVLTPVLGTHTGQGLVGMGILPIVSKLNR